MLTYKRALKITYGIILAGVLGIVCLLLREQALSGNYGQFVALAVAFLFLIYGGISIGRLVKAGKDDKDLKRYLDEIDVKEWNNYHKRIREFRSKISYVRHDLANHIQMYDNLRNMLGCEYPLGRMDQLRKELDRHSGVKYCDDMLLELAIDGKLVELQGKGIECGADICLNNMKQYSCEELCVRLWLDIDRAVKGIEDYNKSKIFITIKSGTQTEEGLIVNWSVKRDGAEPLVDMLEVKRK